MEAACRTLDFTTQRGLRKVLHPSLSQIFRINYWQFQYKWLQHDVFGDTLFSRTNSKRGNKYAELFVSKFGWLRAFPMAKRGGIHEALSLFFECDGVLTNLIVDGSVCLN